MWILALGAILFLIGGIGAIVGRDVPNIIATFSISGTLAVLFAFIWREGGKANSFLAWLFGNSEEISNYSATYQGYPMLWTTEVTHFQASISALVITAKVPSRYLVVGHHNTFVLGLPLAE